MRGPTRQHAEKVRLASFAPTFALLSLITPLIVIAHHIAGCECKRKRAWWA